MQNVKWAYLVRQDLEVQWALVVSLARLGPTRHQACLVQWAREDPQVYLGLMVYPDNQERCVLYPCFFN